MYGDVPPSRALHSHSSERLASQSIMSYIATDDTPSYNHHSNSRHTNHAHSNSYHSNHATSSSHYSNSHYSNHGGSPANRTNGPIDAINVGYHGRRRSSLPTGQLTQQEKSRLNIPTISERSSSAQDVNDDMLSHLGPAYTHQPDVTSHEGSDDWSRDYQKSAQLRRPSLSKFPQFRTERSNSSLDLV